MTDREALLRAVAANPDEDTPRLAYADLLDELGGEANAARAKFIRLQIETHHGPGDTGGTWAFDQKVAEASALAHRFSHEWRRELPVWAYALHAPPARVPVDLYSRGFVERVRVKAKALALRADELFTAAPVRSLAVQAGNPELIPAIFGLPALARLKALAFQWQRAGDDLAAALAGCRWLSGLRELELSHHRLSERGARILARSERLPAVRVIRFRASYIGSDVVSTLAGTAKLSNLREIDLRGVHVWPGTVSELRERFPDKQFHV